MEGSVGTKSAHPYEKIFAVLIALSAALSGLAGFLSAEASRNANAAGMESMKWQNDANAAYDEANQIIINDMQLLADALAQETIGFLNNDHVNYVIAFELRNLTFSVQHGYINYDGSANPLIGDYNLAWNKFVTDMFKNYEAYRANSDDASAEAQEQMSLAGSYLLATVILAFGTVVAAAGISINNVKSKQLMLVVVSVIITTSVVYLLYISFV